MACTPLPTPPAPPALPGGISLLPDITLPTFDEELCCKIVQLPATPALPPLPPGVFNPGLAATVAALVGNVLDFVDGLPVGCAKE